PLAPPSFPPRRSSDLSIYSFQGARPERFAEERSRIARLAKAADADFEQVSLRVSFRSSTEVLKLVDHVFAEADALRGMGSADEPDRKSTRLNSSHVKI